jgi:GT2 family glycosyltransferase
MSPKVEIIIVKYNQPEYEANTIASVLHNTNYSNYTLTAYQNPPGIGLAECWNRLIENSDAEYICLLNSDVVVPDMWLTALMNVFNTVPNIGAIVPSSNKVFLSQIDIPFSHTSRDWDEIQAFADTQVRDGRCISLPTLSAMCVIFPKKLWADIGKFDEDFYLYGEDTEFFYRLGQKTGKHLAWYRGVYVHHYKAQSVAKAVEAGELDFAAIRRKADELCAKKMPDFKVSHGSQDNVPQ